MHKPADVAALLGCSEWWVKEQARRRRIPYTWIGGSYRFTDAHVTDIVNRFERQPTTDPVPAASATPSPRKPGSAAPAEPALLLTARRPRRNQTSRQLAQQPSTEEN